MLTSMERLQNLENLRELCQQNLVLARSARVRRFSDDGAHFGTRQPALRHLLLPARSAIGEGHGHLGNRSQHDFVLQFHRASDFIAPGWRRPPR